MPKTRGTNYIMSKLTEDPTKRRTVPEASVYEPGGGFAFHRVGNNVYRGGERVYSIDGTAVYDAKGVRRFYIADLWWYTYDGVAAYYQDQAIPEVKGDEWPEDPPQT